MFSNNEKLTEFIQTFSENEDILSELCNEEKNKISKEIENISGQFDMTKKYLLNEAKELFAYNTSNFKQPSEELKYKLELLENDDPDYNIIISKDLVLKDKSLVYNIYRVRTTDNVAAQSQTSNSINIINNSFVFVD